MKRQYWLLLLMVVIALFAIPYELQKRLDASHRSEAAYQSALRFYTQELKPGMTRKDVEEYLQAKQIFFQRCCLDEKVAVADVVNIGREPTLLPFPLQSTKCLYRDSVCSGGAS